MSDLQLNWNRSDFERKFAFDSKKYTGVNALFSFLLGIVFFRDFLRYSIWSISIWGI